MEVHLNSNLDAVVRSAASGSKPRVQSTQEPSDTSFAQTDSLNEALKSTPDVRPKAVARARELVASPLYPPTETIRQISSLLAMNMEQSSN